MNSAKNRMNEEKFCIPKCIQGITLPRNLDLNSFVEARITELNHFLDVLEDKAKGRMSTKRNFQLLPKHMRRRAMSHNAHRIPARIRNSKQELAYLKNPCRKTRRHHSKLMQDYIKRNQTSMWLETHIWHAKRMKMIERWGYKLALHCNDKGHRASYRFARDSALIYDQSYQVFLLIKNSSKFYESFGLKAKAGFRKREKFVIKGELVALIDLYSFNDDLIVSVHPSAYEKFCQVISLQGVEILSFKDQINWFSIRGPKSTDMVSRSLDLKNDEVAGLLRDAGRFHGVKFPDGAIIHVEFIKNLHFSSSKEHMLVRHSSDFIPLQPSLEMMKLSYNWPNSFYKPNFWQRFTPNLPVFYHVPEKLTTRSARSRYPKVKPSAQPSPGAKVQTNPDLSKLSQTPSSDHPIIPENPENPNKSSTSSLSAIPKLAKPVLASETVPMDLDSQYLQTSSGLLIYNAGKHGAGWDLILPSEHTSCVFRSFVYSGCKAVGLEEFKLISFENGKAFFPDDYPACTAYEDLSTSQAKERIINYFKRPSAKRVNYERISSPFPFFSDWKLGKEVNRAYDELVLVRVKSYKRCPKDLAYLCRACPEDLIAGKHKEPLTERSENNSKWKPETIYKLSEIKTTREIVGFVTSGGLSFRRCRGFAIGYIKSELSKELPCKGLFRNPNSQFYHLCDFKLA